jgi:hypothetical protein
MAGLYRRRLDQTGDDKNRQEMAVSDRIWQDQTGDGRTGQEMSEPDRTSQKG